MPKRSRCPKGCKKAQNCLWGREFKSEGFCCKPEYPTSDTRHSCSDYRGRTMKNIVDELKLRLKKGSRVNIIPKRNANTKSKDVESYQVEIIEIHENYTEVYTCNRLHLRTTILNSDLFLALCLDPVKLPDTHYIYTPKNFKTLQKYEDKDVLQYLGLKEKDRRNFGNEDSSDSSGPTHNKYKKTSNLF